MKISKKKWYSLGGFKNSHCWRMADRLGRWRYYWDGKQRDEAV